MTSLWTLQEIAQATSGRVVGEDVAIAAISIDSRTLPQGALFWALPGERFDGHDYVVKAKEAGAVAALVSEAWLATQPSLPEIALVVVEDCYRALEALAKAARARMAGKIIGVTGSVGKTSAKEMLKLALGAYGSVYATAGNYNNHIGVPLTLVNMPHAVDYAIIEMGMNHAGEIEYLTGIARPDVSLITNVEAVHLEFFDSVADIARAKAEIFSGVVSGGTAILPRDNTYYDLLLESASQSAAERILSFGQDDDADIRLSEAHTTREGTQVCYQYKGEASEFRLGTLGAHWPAASLAIIAVVEALGLPRAPAEATLAAYKEQPGRGEASQIALPAGGVCTLIDDAYNASPVSMKAALTTLAALMPGQGGSRKAILGQMLELGEDSAAFHAQLASFVEAAEITEMLLVGELMAHLKMALPPSLRIVHVAKAEEGRAWLSHVQPGDIVLCKGSHGSGVYQLAGWLKGL